MRCDSQKRWKIPEEMERERERERESERESKGGMKGESREKEGGGRSMVCGMGRGSGTKRGGAALGER